MTFGPEKTRRASRIWVLLLSAASLFAVALTPATAKAGGSVHLDFSGISIGFHDDHHNKQRYRRVHKERHRYYDRHHDRYYDNWRKRRFYDRGHRRYHDNRRYRNDHYYGGRSNRYYGDRYYRDRRTQVCPYYGYSRYYRKNLNCYRHKDHFHCD